MRPWAAALIAAGLGSGAQAQGVCSGEVVFQCATDAPEAEREQITVCQSDARFEMVRHHLASGELRYDVPLTANGALTHYTFGWLDEETIKVELGFWDEPYAMARILHMALPWNEEEDEQRLDLPSEAWLQTADWRMPIEQELCLPQTVYADLATMELGFVDRGPVGLFFSGDEIVPTPETVGRARVQTDTTVSVYQWHRPNAATPVWRQLYDGDEVEVLAVQGAFRAVAIPIGVSECVIRPEDMGHPYNGPCATGWADQQYLQILQ
ncbi:hypothetical protein T7987_06690 [Sulfitobacter faviae]|uniref:Uncharacterized protein n=1 Tax=Sulfitobacter faviae TaxID=1775881 RepID=A0ABZ0V219_9RHOB|nr:hypothetical protein [Sulfitobacter faviae]WPZ22911.1 hypothetical protein T7987_06690 [Sulfitobacter faviae]